MSEHLIIGANGKVGRRIAEHLAVSGQIVQRASRSGDDVRFDWFEPATWAPARGGGVRVPHGARVVGRLLPAGDRPAGHRRAGRRAPRGHPLGAYVSWRMAMLEGMRQGRDAFLSDGVQRVLGRPPTSFADWAAREARALRTPVP